MWYPTPNAGEFLPDPRLITKQIEDFAVNGKPIPMASFSSPWAFSSITVLAPDDFVFPQFGPNSPFSTIQNHTAVFGLSDHMYISYTEPSAQT